MSAPTVRISASSRRILQDLSEQTGASMQSLLDQAVEDFRRKRFLEEVNAGYAALRADRAAWEEVQADRSELDSTLLDGLASDESWTDADAPVPKKKRKKA